MDTPRMALKSRNLLTAFTVITTIALLAVTDVSFSAQANAEAFVNLAAGAGAPGASGEVTIELVGGVAVGEVEVNNLPAQPFGLGHFYGVWFVRNDTGNKAFLGAIIGKDSIILAQGGNGEMKFGATHFTTGPNAGSPITFGAPGTNVIIVLIENTINGFTPSPIGPVPGTGVAVVGMF